MMARGSSWHTTWNANALHPRAATKNVRETSGRRIHLFLQTRRDESRIQRQTLMFVPPLR
ncbi:MAG TPA: hypothetical protein VGB18_01490 [Candidatus Thermoplasmatota archaeon]